ncbi:MAG: ATP-binding cassette domain-containing protein [Candidatus Nanopelagicales bacterium]
MGTGATVASLRAVTKTYGEGDAEVHALRGVDLELRTGEVVVVLGPSGSGKTTLLNVAGGIEPATSGRVELGGVELADKDPEELATVRRDTVAFIFQFFNLIQTLTAAENVRVIAELSIGSVCVVGVCLVDGMACPLCAGTCLLQGKPR